MNKSGPAIESRSPDIDPRGRLKTLRRELASPFASLSSNRSCTGPIAIHCRQFISPDAAGVAPPLPLRLKRARLIVRRY